MIPSRDEIIARCELFDDSFELAETLRLMAEDDCANGSWVYYLKESADHIEGMFEQIRALKSIVMRDNVPAQMASSHRRKLTKDERRERDLSILIDSVSGETSASVANRYGVSPHSIKDILSRTIIWRVPDFI